MDVNTVKGIFGVMPLNQLTAAQELAKKKRNQKFYMGMLISAAVTGILIGIQIQKARETRRQYLSQKAVLDRFENVPKPKPLVDSSKAESTPENSESKPKAA